MVVLPSIEDAMLHVLRLREMGLMLGEIRRRMSWPPTAARTKSTNSCWSLTLLLIPGAVGSPVAPLAIK
jgi:hypothetical protein